MVNAANPVYNPPYKCRVWYPATVAFDAATVSLELKAPEIGNQIIKARNQVISRTKAGNVIAYDRGNNLNDELLLQFQNIPDVKRSALVVFLDYINWAASIFKFEDHNGTQYNVRCKTSTLAYKDTGMVFRKDDRTGVTLWDFDLQLLDVGSSTYDGAGIVPSQLALHLADYDHPHNPLTTTTVNIADGAKVVDSQLVDNYNAIIWVGSAKVSTNVVDFVVTARHDGTAGADAANTNYSVQTEEVMGTLAITLATTISGAGTTQTINLTLSTGTDATLVRVRRIKL